jgi:hypothetical protein
MTYLSAAECLEIAPCSMTSDFATLAGAISKAGKAKKSAKQTAARRPSEIKTRYAHLLFSFFIAIRPLAY